MDSGKLPRRHHKADSVKTSAWVQDIAQKHVQSRSQLQRPTCLPLQDRNESFGCEAAPRAHARRCTGDWDDCCAKHERSVRRGRRTSIESARRHCKQNAQNVIKNADTALIVASTGSCHNTSTKLAANSPFLRITYVGDCKLFVWHVDSNESWLTPAIIRSTKRIPRSAFILILIGSKGITPQ